ncbi:MAG: hypothetical protein M1835_002729 [Candelina submexicana]|nr:MAG: hypothetical protein M1835_002729 [Candelina submexicana]
MSNVRSLAQQNHAFNATKSEQGYVAAQQQPAEPPKKTIGVQSAVSTSTKGPPDPLHPLKYFADLRAQAVRRTGALAFSTERLATGSKIQAFRTMNPSTKPSCLNWYALSLCCGLQWAFQMGNRQEIRTRYKIDGSTKGDCLRSYFCGCCELMQEEKEVLLRSHDRGSTAPSNEYKQQEGMVYGAQQPQ